MTSLTAMRRANSKRRVADRARACHPVASPSWPRSRPSARSFVVRQSDELGLIFVGSRSLATMSREFVSPLDGGGYMTTRDRVREGDTLGRYELLSRVGRGGMATVWAARHHGAHGFSRIVALKTMLPELSDDADFQQMFLAEARLAARIRHPNVLETLDLGEEKGVLYIAMEWIVLQLKRAQMVRLLTVAWILVLTIVAVTGCGGGASGRDSSNTMTVTQGVVDCKS